MGRRAPLDKRAFANNRRKHSWQKAETRLATRQLLPGPPLTLSSARPDEDGGNRTRGNSKLAESTGSHLDGTSPNPCPVIYYRSRARALERGMDFITKLHVVPATDGSIFIPGFLSRSLSISLFPLPAFRGAKYPPLLACAYLDYHIRTTSLCEVDVSRKSYLSFVVNGS